MLSESASSLTLKNPTIVKIKDLNDTDNNALHLAAPILAALPPGVENRALVKAIAVLQANPVGKQLGKAEPVHAI